MSYPVRKMHYEFKLLFNKVDSEKYRDYQVYEIDTFLNMAQDIILKSIAMPRFRNGLGFEVNTRATEDIREVVEDLKNPISIIPCDDTSVLVQLPEDFCYMLRGYAEAQQGTCKKKIRLHAQQHDDMFEEDSFGKSSFKWERINFLNISERKLKLFKKDFEINNLCSLGYIRKPLYIHAAADFKKGNGTYKSVEGDKVYSGYQDCELTKAGSEIVRVAVLLASAAIDSPTYTLKDALSKISN